MAETREILELWESARCVALITLVRVEGSSYRRPGARLLVAEDGRTAGSISGGCLEAELVRKAAWMVRSGAVVERFSSLFDDTADMPYGLGCGGTVDLLIEPANTPECAAMIDALRSAQTRKKRRVRTWRTPQGLHRRVRDDAGAVVFQSKQAVSDTHALFDESLDPPQRVLVFGAGEDAKPVVELAWLLGWQVVIVDSRRHLALPGRFPKAAEVRSGSSLPDAQVEIDHDDAVVIMTHSYEQDRTWLCASVASRPRYIGLLGARQRSRLLLGEAAQRTGMDVEAVAAKVHAPIGLHLGGDGPEAVALAVIAEIQSVMHGTHGGLRASEETVPVVEVAYVPGRCSL